eukprot:CAMPEP_0201526512 /NCGR_PEP_ID=MMETSP0161_2-20130828/31997_1 /ASSEMBLY_ACC=CAM_ASM_000251 /TAXON_ID=180227 /ORGANISM="Neoparamoeba aestuarina, Strain SoJaBio B1-5/56/2" /LENGTH=201 /DNA_ID=CAMNT_0047926931 /DNA_START=130 /DNA_END=735 /DNA_ORIENTATION=+
MREGKKKKRGKGLGGLKGRAQERVAETQTNENTREIRELLKIQPKEFIPPVDLSTPPRIDPEEHESGDVTFEMMSKLLLSRSEVAFVLSSPGNDLEIPNFFVKSLEQRQGKGEYVLSNIVRSEALFDFPQTMIEGYKVIRQIRVDRNPTIPFSVNSLSEKPLTPYEFVYLIQKYQLSFEDVEKRIAIRKKLSLDSIPSRRK